MHAYANHVLDLCMMLLDVVEQYYYRCQSKPLRRSELPSSVLMILHGETTSLRSKENGVPNPDFVTVQEWINRVRDRGGLWPLPP